MSDSDDIQQVSDHRSVHVTFADPEESGMAGESVWCIRIGDAVTPGHGLYRVDNIPFFITTPGFSYGAVVMADETRKIDLPDSPYHGQPAAPEFVRVVEPADGVTVSVLFHEGLPNPVQLAIVDQLRAAGGEVERAQETFWAMFMPTGKRTEIEAILESRLGMAHLEYSIPEEDED